MEKFIYGLLSHKTGNVGNEIQSVATLQFLPRVDLRLDAGTLNKVKSKNKIRIIMNGWFSHEPHNWPPSDIIDPLFLSFHIAQCAVENFTSPKSIDYFKKHEPIGCRDTHTQKILEDKGVQAYFSGCLTLTLKKPSVDKHNNIVIADLEKEAEKVLPKEIRDHSIYTNHWGYSQYTKKASALIPHPLKSFIRKLGLNTLSWFFLNKIQEGDKFKKARELLKTYAGAKLVVTSRLHCALPCLAFGTPVIFVYKDLNDPRFGGLLDYLRAYSTEDFKKNIHEINWENPLPNPRDITPLQEALRKTCENFINN
ncbi:hypothetical protein A2738_03870 [Candidatus Nomurabacteria bacterium RIFCSPHIGHO2_01_FULL_42_15]|uniref:Polysaccharide pyruvyl transferase domain-containing protein n=1 Tax=Candidatus Nomurabacteria bacterium RIFCSPHIGHO2_01_FULL_42_15 TaxID=1801742 RepID=A0A1F6VE84_9BACT|nr:MAG: hypothetical protein A2738_03870 [Candidatus Nomurabacteria bacterium RIFCSPHIGHO2_01_FULL_42_15]OGI93341.1 MAG: hypothetical protein A3A99_03725 [Candidatus Nomurabacteria bacterium RIFCSPLOWO2_01_FULL_41_18]